MQKIIEKNIFFLDLLIIFSLIIIGLIYFNPILLTLLLFIRCLIRFNESPFIKFFCLIIIIKFMFYMSLEASENYLKYIFLNIYLILFLFQILDYSKLKKINFDFNNIKLKTKNLFKILFITKISILWLSLIILDINLIEIKTYGQLYKYFLSLSFIYLLFIKEKLNQIELLTISFFLVLLIIFTFIYNYSRYELMCFTIFLIFFNNIQTIIKILFVIISVFVCLLIVQHLKNDFFNLFEQLRSLSQYPYSDYNYILTFLDSIFTKFNYFHYFETFIYKSSTVPMYENYMLTQSIDKFGSVFDIGFITELYLISDSYFYFYIFIILLTIYLIQIFCTKFILFYKYIIIFMLFNLYNYFDSIVYKQNNLFLISFTILILFIFSLKVKKS